ncbi:hypothetical protein H4R35_007634 [Dimargaris xerosporica]|nr:hypothetical protein H4R35_007634 [Dimargaris xerosporica]
MAQQLAELIEYAESGHSTFRLGPQKPAFHLTAQELFEGLESSKIVMLFYWDNTAGSFIIEFPYLLDGNTMVLDCRQLWKFLTTAHLASSYVMFDGPINHDDIKSARSVLFQTLRPLRGRFAAALNVAH